MNKTFWRLAFRGLVRHRRRTLLTASAFVVGYVGLFILAGYIHRVEKVLRNGALYERVVGHLRIQKKGAINYWAKPKKYLISEGDLHQLNQVVPAVLGKDLEFTSEKLKVAAQLAVGTKSLPILIDGIDMASEAKARTHPEFKKWFQSFFSYYPAPFTKEDQGHFGISITPTIARSLGEKVNSEKDKVNLEAQIVGLDFESSLNAIDVRVNRIHLSGSQFMQDLSVEMDIKDLRNFAQTEGVSEWNLFLRPGISLAEPLRRVEEALAKSGLSHLEVQRFDTEAVSPEYIGYMGILSVIMIFFLLLIGGSVILSVLNVLTMSIFERSTEIGTLLSLGYSRAQVRSMFIIEGLIMGLLGIFFGVGLSALVGAGINQLRIQFHPPGALGVATVTVDLMPWIGVAIGILLLGLLLVASFILTQQQTKKNLVQLLYDVEGVS